MKYIVVLADGMADEPIDELNGLTPVMSANTPVLDEICNVSATGLAETIPHGFHPGSEIANMNILGYHPKDFFQGRGVLEASSLGIIPGPDDLVMRCNLVSLENDILINHSAGHISSEEASQIIDTLNDKLGSDTIHFYPGTSYRHILIIKGGNADINCIPPHDHPNKPALPLFPTASSSKGEATARILSDLMLKSIEILKNHPVNISREKNGKKRADSIWPWSPGFMVKFPSFYQRWGIKTGSVISAVDLIHGIGHMAGLDSVYVKGATGLHDTNYEGKAQAALETLKKQSFVFLHVEAMDEAGHEGDYMLKKKVIEDFDKRLLKPVWEGLKSMGEPFSLLLLPDHPTPCKLRTHTSDAVPFMIYKPSLEADSVKEFNEQSVRNGHFGKIDGSNILSLLFND